MKVTALSDEDLTGALKQLVATEHCATADVVEHLAEVDARRLHIIAGCSSLTAYCEERLGYSHDEARHRVTAARRVQTYPMILPMLRSGALSLSTLRILSPVLTASNHRERLEAAVGRTRTEVERIVAGWAPKPDVPTQISALPSNEPPALLAMMAAAADTAPKPLAPLQPPSQPEPAPPPRPAPLPKPLTPERFELKTTIDEETYKDLMKLRDQMRHSIPDGDIAKIIKRAVKDLRAKVEARTFGKRETEPPKPEKPPTAKPVTASPSTALPSTASPSTALPSTDLPSTALPSSASPSTEPPQATRPISKTRAPESIIRDVTQYEPRAPGRALKRAIAERDQEQCTYVSDDGHRCSSTAWLEHDHALDWAFNGATSIANLRLLCDAHHALKHEGPPSADV